jgi:hypothetical protein
MSKDPKKSKLSFQIMSTNDDDADRLTNTRRRKEPDNPHPNGYCQS